MARGIVRHLDELGRITLPIEYRKTLGINENDPVGMFTDGTVIHLVKADKSFKGILRNLDQLGRYTLPIEVRRTLNFTENQKVDIYINYPDEICIQKEGCSFCCRTEKIKIFKGVPVCKKCAEELSDQVKEDAW